jgi:hypothetical protein
VCYVCVYIYVKVIDLKIRHKKDQITVVISCMNAKLYKLSSMHGKTVIDMKYMYVKRLVSRLVRSRSIQ